MITLIFRIAVITTLIMSALGVIYYSQTENTRSEQPVHINAFMDQARYTTYNKKGQINLRVQSQTMYHHKQKDSSSLIKPTMTLYTRDRFAWHITADYGTSKNGIQIIHLMGHVLLKQAKSLKYVETTIRTDQLTIYPDKNLATTPDTVTIKRGKSLITGKGLRANLKTGKITLFTHSQGIYEPETP